MMTRRFTLVVLTLAVGCGLPSPSDQSAVTSVPANTIASTTAPASTTALGSTNEIVRSSGRPDHLRSQGRDQTEQTDVVIASSAADPLPTPITTETVEAAPPVATAPSTTVRSTTPPATTTVATATTTVAPVSDGAAGVAFVAAINGLRAGVGVGTLGRSADLDARAQAWTENMAGRGDLGHSSIVGDLVAGSWSTAGENVGYGPSVDSVFAALVASSGHYTNMVNASFTMVGVGVVVDGNGLVWTTHLFGG